MKNWQNIIFLKAYSSGILEVKWHERTISIESVGVIGSLSFAIKQDHIQSECIQGFTKCQS